MCEEIFGPVLTIFVYDENKYEETLDLVNTTSEYALTGAVITLGKIISDSTVLLTEPETAHEEMTKTEFQTALAKYKMPGIVAGVS